ncbi:MAG: hypothetical protein KAH07_01755 [Flavobacteriaceae bacterium]|nr:hypothetical protein [Flavobacteriaceae bacterium]
MKTKNLFRFAFVIAIFSIQNIKANTFNSTTVIYNSNNAITFVENGITFSVFQNGEFDFYLNSHLNNSGANYYSSNVSISFNSGYNYNRFVQYGQFGAVIQVERTPVFYDHYGRVTSIGRININYRRGSLHRVGGLHIHYNSNGNYVVRNGYINSYNRNYVYHPHHNSLIRPYAGYHVVRLAPYRNHYKPTRYHYYNDHRYAYKHHRDYHEKYRNKRTKHQKQHSSRSNAYSNDIRSKSVSSNYRKTSNTKRYPQSNGYSKKSVNHGNSTRVDSKNTKTSKNHRTNKRVVSLNNRNNQLSKTSPVAKNKASKHRSNSSANRSPRVTPSKSNHKGNAQKYSVKKTKKHSDNRRTRS